MAILAGENELIRPDKIWIKAAEVIVIEIKTGLAKSEHIKQLCGYRDALKNIFPKPVNAYLYYVSSTEFLAV